MGSELVSLRIENQIATLTIRRESSLNALNVEVLNALSEAFTRVRFLCLGATAYESCRVLVLRGAGPKAFVAGADIKAMCSLSGEGARKFTVLGQRVMRECEALPLPVVALVQGFAFGGGLELALSADLILASENALLGQPEVKLGLIPGFGGTQRLIRRVGIGQAKKLILTGDEISGAEASRIGLVDYLCPPESLEETLAAICASLLARSPLAIASAKRAIGKHVEASTFQGLVYEQEEFIASFDSPDAIEGLAAFVNKRPAKFLGHC